MHHAHDKNILHRSLKPASILLTSGVASAPREGAPRGANAAPLVSGSLKITDFGLARRPVEGDTSDVDLQGEWPCYLAPEQAWGRAKEIGPATDVYALGAILHELITGQPPFRADTPIETLDAIQFREVPPLYRLRRRVPGDLDAICRKCLAKQPRRRYASALELAEDLHRYTNRYPIAARTASNVERFGKCLRRNLRIVALVLLLLWAGVSLLALFAGSGQPQTARPSREAAFRDSLTRLETELAQSRRRQSDINYLNCLLKVERALANGEPQRIEDLLTRCPVQSRNWEWYYLRARHQGAKPLPSFSNDLPVAAVDVSRDGRYLAIAGGELRKSAKARGEVSLWDLATRQRVQRWTVDEPIRGVAFSDDTTQVAFVSSAGSRGDSEIQVRAVPAGQLIARRREPGLRLSSIAYSPNQTRLLLACGDGSILSVPPNLKDEPIATPVAFHGAWRVGEMRGQLLPLAPDPDRLALISPDGGQVAIIEDTRQGSSHTLRGLATTTLALAYDPHHWTLATAGRDQTIRLWEVSFPFQSTGTLRGHQGAVTGVSFTRDGERLASCGEDGTVRIWNAKQEVELLTLKERFKDASGVLFAPTEGGQGMPGVNRLVIVHDKKVTVIEPR